MRGERFVLNLCDDHYEKVRTNHPDAVDWLIGWCAHSRGADDHKKARPRRGVGRVRTSPSRTCNDGQVFVGQGHRFQADTARVGIRPVGAHFGIMGGFEIDQTSVRFDERSKPLVANLQYVEKSKRT